MSQYRVIFHGRKAGAIGISHFCVVDLEAETPDAALLKAYETHDHIFDPRVIDLATGEIVKKGH